MKTDDKTHELNKFEKSQQSKARQLEIEKAIIDALSDIGDLSIDELNYVLIRLVERNIDKIIKDNL